MKTYTFNKNCMTENVVRNPGSITSHDVCGSQPGCICSAGSDPHYDTQKRKLNTVHVVYCVQPYFKEIFKYVCVYIYIYIYIYMYLGLDIKESAGNARDLGSIPGSGRYAGEGNGYSFQYSCLGNPIERGAWQLWSKRLQRVRHNWVTNILSCSYV